MLSKMILAFITLAYCPGLDPSLPGYAPGYYSVPNELKRSRYVVVGRVIGETWLGDDGKPKPLQPPFQGGSSRPLGFDPYAGALYEIKVIRMIKGRPVPRLALFSENSTARFWLEVGKEYLFFVSEETFDDPIGRRLTIDTCGNSAPLAAAKDVLKLLAHTGKGR